MRCAVPRELSIALVLVALACGPAPVSPPPAVPVPTASVAVAAPRPPAPTRVEAGGMPTGVEVYAELPDVAGLIGAVRGKPGLGAMPLGFVVLATEAGVPPATADALLSAVRSAHLGGKRLGGDLTMALSVVLDDPKPVLEAIEHGTFEPTGELGDHGKRLTLRGEKESFAFVWFEGPRLLVTGDEPMLAAIAAVVEGRTKPVGEAERGAPVLASEAGRQLAGFVAPALLATATGGKVAFPTPISAAYALWEGGYRGGWRATLAATGGKVDAAPPTPRALAIARRLPAETAAYLALSTAFPGGSRGFREQLDAAGAAWGVGPGEVAGIDAVLTTAGLAVGEIVGALGGEGVVGVSIRRGLTSHAEIERGFAIVWLQEIAHAEPFERAIASAKQELARSKGKKKVAVRADAGGFTAELRDEKLPFARVRLGSGRLFVGVGQKDLVERALEAVEKGKGTLGDDAAHARALGALPDTAAIRAWADLGRGVELASAAAGAKERAVLAAMRIETTGPKRLTSATSLRLLPDDGRVRVELDEVNGVGLLATSALYGVRRYLANAKAAEAKSTLSAVGRAAITAFERGQLGASGAVVHALCRSATAVPAKVPRGVKHLPSVRPGDDWHTGDDASGWRCLRFELPEPHYFRYGYSAGGPYKGPALGGPDPGPDGFEVTAEGDLDGDGETSLFTLAGRVDPTTGAVVLANGAFIARELE